MANHNVSITSSSFYDPEMGTERFTSANPSSLNITQGDTVTFTYTQQSGGQSYVTMTNFDSGEWNSTANATLYNGQSVVRTRTAVGSDTVTANFPASSFTDRNISITAVSNIDDTPDSFNLGAFVSSASRSTVYQAQTVTVSGLSGGTSITASITNGVFTVNDGSYSNATSSSKSVQNGDSIRVWNTSSSSYSTAITTTLNLNGVTDTWRITTAAAPIDPQNGVLIPLGITSGAIDMNTLRDFFGAPTYQSNQIAMTDLYKGGQLVPNITQNSSVPTSGTISLSNLYSSYTSFFWEKDPTSKFAFEPSWTGGGTATLAWNMSTNSGTSDIEVGYNQLKLDVEYRYTVTNTNGLSRIIANGVTTNNPTGTYTSPWIGEATTLILERDYNTNNSISLDGTVSFEVRKVHNGTTYTLPTKSALWGIVIESNE